MEKNNRHYKVIGRVRLRIGLLFLATLAMASWSGAFATDAVSDWNAITEQAVGTSGHHSVPDGRTVIDWNLTGVTTFLQVAPTLGPRSAPLGSRAMAMMHVAMADAVFSIHPVYKPYAVWLRGHGSADQLAAACGGPWRAREPLSE